MIATRRSAPSAEPLRQSRPRTAGRTGSTRTAPDCNFRSFRRRTAADDRGYGALVAHDIAAELAGGELDPVYLVETRGLEHQVRAGEQILTLPSDEFTHLLISPHSLRSSEEVVCEWEWKMELNDLFGAWKLISLQFVVTGSGECKDMYGADPLGYIFITPDNRMMTIVTSKDRVSSDSESGDAALFRSMMAYSGHFRIEGEDQFITKVEVSWHPGWLGTEQARTFSVVDDILSIKTAEVLHPMFPGRKGCGVLKWQRTSTF